MSDLLGSRLPPRPVFLRRLFRTVLLAAGIVSFSLTVGMLGYHHLAGFPWLDALLNSSMILTGMGPVDPLKTSSAKIFASLYALFSGVVFLTVVALVMSPVVHRFLHRYHLDLDDDRDA